MTGIEIARLFRESKERPVHYRDLLLVRSDTFELPGSTVPIRFRIISTNSEWRQGIALDTKGTVAFQGRTRGDSVVLWQDTAPASDVFICASRDRLLRVKNVWDTGDGTIQSWINGAAMWTEEIPGGKRYHCNDGHFDDNFDDIIFDLRVTF